MRLFTVAAPVLVATTVFFEARFWPIATAIGQVLVAMVNFVICTFAAKSIGEARNLGISTVGTTTNRNVSIQSFRAWVPSAAFYAAMVVPIAILIYVGVLHDVGMYAIAVSAINIFLFYMVKCASGGRDIRVGFSRGWIAAEQDYGTWPILQNTREIHGLPAPRNWSRVSRASRGGHRHLTAHCQCQASFASARMAQTRRSGAVQLGAIPCGSVASELQSP